MAASSGPRHASAFLSDGPAAAPGWRRRFRRSIRLPLGLSELVRVAAGRSLPRKALMALAGHVPWAGSLAALLTRLTPQ